MELAIGIIIGLAIGISLSFLLVRGRDALIAVKDKENGRLAEILVQVLNGDHSFSASLRQV